MTLAQMVTNKDGEVISTFFEEQHENNKELTRTVVPEIFRNDFITGKTSCLENIIIEHYASIINFQKADNILNNCLFEIILSEIFFYKISQNTV